MTLRSTVRLVLTMIPAVCLAGCHGSTSPSSNAVADFLTGVTAGGSTAARESGAPPAPSGGPTLTVTSSGSVASGGNDAASLQASSPFQTVYVSVGGATGFYQLQLGAATTSITVTDGLASQIPTSSYVVSYEVASSAGQVGAPANVTNTVQTVTSLAVSGTAALAVSQTSQLTATATLSGGTTENVTSTATWRSSNTAVATVSSGGLVTAVAAGTATITATALGKSGTLPISITAFQLQGLWNLGITPTQAMNCSDPLNIFQSAGQTTVDSSGSFTYRGVTGTMNLSTGAWSVSGAFPAGTSCVTQFSASGTCSSSTACGGTYSGTSPGGGGTESGTFTWSRTSTPSAVLRRTSKGFLFQVP